MDSQEISRKAEELLKRANVKGKFPRNRGWRVCRLPAYARKRIY